MHVGIIRFGDLIKKYRDENKITQSEFSKLIDKKQATVSNYENGVHFPDDAEEIKIISKIIKVPIDIVIDSILYTRDGCVVQHETIIELDKIELQSRYKFTFNNKEVTSEELGKMLDILQFERFKSNQKINNE